jgi:hypothetical protein
MNCETRALDDGRHHDALKWSVVLARIVLTALWKCDLREILWRAHEVRSRIQDFITHRQDYSVTMESLLLLRMQYEQAGNMATYCDCHMDVSLDDSMALSQ